MALKKTIIEPSWEAKYSFSPAVVTEGGNKRSKEQHCRVFGSMISDTHMLLSCLQVGYILRWLQSASVIRALG